MFLEIYILNSLHYNSWILQPLLGSYGGHKFNLFLSHNNFNQVRYGKRPLLNYKNDWVIVSDTTDNWYDSSIFKRKGSYLLTLTYLTFCYWFILKITFKKYFASEAGSIVYFSWYFAFAILSHIQNLIRCGAYDVLYSPTCLFFLWNSARGSLWDSWWMIKWQRF